MPSDQDFELFRLASLRAPDRATAQLPLILLEQIPEKVDRGPDALVSPDGILLDFSFYAGPDMAYLHVRDLDSELNNRGDAWDPTEIQRWIQTTSGHPLDQFTNTDDWHSYKSSAHAALQSSLREGGTARLGKLRQPAGLMRLTRLIAMLDAIVSNHPTLATDQDVRNFLSNAQVVLSSADFSTPLDRLARPPGIADLKVVRLGVPRYEASGIAHIENVMASETRERDHRVLNRDEITLTTSTDKTTEQEKDLQTTSQVQLIQEANQAVHDTSSITAGLTISASYGPTVSASLNTSLARTETRDEATRTASTYSNQITQQARQKVVERISVQRVVTQLTETEETNKHAFSNVGTNAQNIVGIYRHVDQVQDAWIENYGKRLMLEFMVPEPAAVVLWAIANKPQSDAGPEPARPALIPSDITEANYLQLVAQNAATGAKAPPPPTIDLSVSFEGDEAHNDLILFQDSKSLKVPDGYKATSWHAQGVMWGRSNDANEHSWMVGVGNEQGASGEDSDHLMKELHGKLSAEAGSELPVLMLARAYINIAASVLIHCDRTEEAMQNWQLDIYGRIMDSFQQRHQDWVALKQRADADAALSAGQGFDSSPEVNRAAERSELRRLVIEELLGASEDAGQFGGHAVVYPDSGHPYIDESVAATQRDGILFFEQAFEWENMTWIHYPYYWSNAHSWRDSILRSGQDSNWEAFLNAGASRTVVPVRPGFEHAINLYLTTGVIWAGGPVPTVGDPTYLGIAEEIAQSLNAAPENSTRVDLDPVRLPTGLIWLQPTGDLNPAPAP